MAARQFLPGKDAEAAGADTITVARPVLFTTGNFLSAQRTA
jgi:hypothetical protein